MYPYVQPVRPEPWFRLLSIHTDRYLPTYRATYLCVLTDICLIISSPLTKTTPNASDFICMKAPHMAVTLHAWTQSMCQQHSEQDDYIHGSNSISIKLAYPSPTTCVYKLPTCLPRDMLVVRWERRTRFVWQHRSHHAPMWFFAYSSLVHYYLPPATHATVGGWDVSAPPELPRHLF